MTYNTYIECATEEYPRGYFGISKEDKFEVLDYHEFCTRVALVELKYDITD